MELVVKNGPLRGERRSLGEGPITIGRQSDATITIDDSKASRLHAIIEADKRGWRVRDLHSTNSTYVNGSKVDVRELQDGDTIRIGSTEFGVEDVRVYRLEPGASSAELSLEISPEAIDAALRNTSTVRGQNLPAALFKLGTLSTAHLTLEEYLHECLVIVERIVPHSAWAWLNWKNGPAGDYTIIGEQGGVSVPCDQITVSRSVIDEAMRSRQALVSSQIREQFDLSMEARPGAPACALVVPIFTQRYKSFALYLERDRSQPHFKATDLDVVVVLATQICSMAENILLYSALSDAYNNLDEYLNRLNKSERLASIGRLASGFAHDLNNPLCSLLGFIELAQRWATRELEAAESEKILEYLDKAGHAANFCRALSRNVLAFARESTFSEAEFQPIPIAATIRNTLAICDSKLRGTGAEVEVHVAEDLELIGPATVLQQVVMNLVANAADAIHDSDQECGTIIVSAVERSGEITLTFTDDGPGIPDKIRNQIFEPLFTTKGESKGTGLGLYVVKKLIRDSGGEIELDSTPGQGTTFTVKLPVRLRPAIRAGEKDPTASLKSSEIAHA